jgi:hypothetical protein
MKENPGIDEKHTPFSSFVSLLPGALDDVVAQDVCNLDRMVNLHSSVHGRATVLLKVLARFLARCDEDREIVYSGRQYERKDASVAVVFVKRTVEDNPGRPEKLPIGTLSGSSSGGGHGEKQSVHR